MGYEKDTDAGSGYGPHTSPGGGYSTSAAASYLPTPTPKTAQADFSYLSPLRDGVGKYRMNHFVAYFKPQGDKSQPVNPIAFWYKNFCPIFSRGNLAVVSPAPARKFKGLDTLKFTYSGEIGNAIRAYLRILYNVRADAPHDDWVAMQMAKDGKSFYAMTLKREWSEPVDMLGGPFNSTSPLAGPVPAVVEANKRHALAGRRSWRVELDSELDLYRVETAAFERDSDPFYMLVDMTFDMHKEVEKLWIRMLENYPATLCPIKATNLVPAGYDVEGNVAYRSGENESAQKALLTDWFSGVLKRHPGLVTDL